MRAVWLVAKQEYIRNVLRRRFLFALLSIPAIIAVMLAVSLILIRTISNTAPVGYVDLSGFLKDPLRPEAGASEDTAEIVAFASEDEAQAALNAGQIQAYYVLAPDYLQTSKARMVSTKKPSQEAQQAFNAFLRENLLRNQPEAVRQRIWEGDHLQVETPDGSRKLGEGEWFAFIVPFLTGFIFLTATFSTSGYLMQALVEEKENRTMEVIVTSISAGQLMAGKVIGVIGVGLTQLLVWGAMIVLAVLIGQTRFPWMAGIRLSPEMIAVVVIMFLPGFVFIAALMAAVGATVVEAREGQQISGLFSLPVVAPYWLIYTIMTKPNSPIPVALSLFPFTAPVTMVMRAGFAVVPWWQVALSAGILAACSVGALWLAGKAFRLGMLQYGQRISFRRLLLARER